MRSVRAVPLGLGSRILIRRHRGQTSSFFRAKELRLPAGPSVSDSETPDHRPGRAADRPAGLSTFPAQLMMASARTRTSLEPVDALRILRSVEEGGGLFEHVAGASALTFSKAVTASVTLLPGHGADSPAPTKSPAGARRLIQGGQVEQVLGVFSQFRFCWKVSGDTSLQNVLSQNDLRTSGLFLPVLVGAAAKAKATCGGASPRRGGAAGQRAARTQAAGMPTAGARGAGRVGFRQRRLQAPQLPRIAPPPAGDPATGLRDAECTRPRACGFPKSSGIEGGGCPAPPPFFENALFFSQIKSEQHRTQRPDV